MDRRSHIFSNFGNRAGFLICIYKKFFMTTQEFIRQWGALESSHKIPPGMSIPAFREGGREPSYLMFTAVLPRETQKN